MIYWAFFFLLGAIAGAAAVWKLTPAPETAPAPAPDLTPSFDEMRRQLTSYQDRITTFEKEHAGSQAQIQQQLQSVVAAGVAMRDEARTLRQALATNSGVRGAWGESVLQNILNACGLNVSVDYDLQPVLAEGLRPDAVIHLPSGRTLAIDAKASLNDFLAGLDAPDEARRLAAYAEFAKVLRRRAKELAARDYPARLDRSLPCVVMFVPSEGAFRASLDADADLFTYAQALQPPVLVASPSTLFPLISVVAQGWQQHQATQQMQQLLAEVGTLGERLETFVKHLQGVGKALDSAGKAYLQARASFRTRVAPQLNRLEELNSGWGPAAELVPLEHQPLLADEAAAGEP